MCEAVELPPPGPVLHETAAEVALVDAPLGVIQPTQLDMVQDFFEVVEDQPDSACVTLPANEIQLA